MGVMGTEEFKIDPNFTAWGPFIKSDYYVQPITKNDILISGCIFAASMSVGLLAAYQGVLQVRAARSPLQSAYIWMIWIELVASAIIAVLCLLYLLKEVRPSFYFYMAILFLWSLEIQLLLQIIINRIRIIIADPIKGRNITIGVATIITLINISVFCIWIPARLQISNRFIHINNIWDRIEKVIYLMIDASLNWYFIRVVKINLVENGLEKYNSLVRFNQRIIIVSLLMDIMIIGAMSIPNGFVYAIFHPLGFLVKLNIEICMANLIRKIAYEKSLNGNQIWIKTFSSNCIESLSDEHADKPKRNQHHIIPLMPTTGWLKSLNSSTKSSNPPEFEFELEDRKFNSEGGPITVDDNRILKTRNFCVHSHPKPKSNVVDEDYLGANVKVKSKRSNGSYYSEGEISLFSRGAREVGRMSGEDGLPMDIHHCNSDETELIRPMEPVHFK